MKVFLVSALAVFIFHSPSFALEKPAACPKERPVKSAVVYSVSYEEGGTAVGRIFICSVAPLKTEALWVETEEHIKSRKDMAGAKAVQITNIIDLKK